MKKYISILYLLLLTALIGCEENDPAYSYNGYFADASIISSNISTYTNASSYKNSYIIRIGTTVEYKDLSRGTTTHFWEINEGFKYLNPSYTIPSDDYTPYIIEGQTARSTDFDIYLLAVKDGEANVRVYNEFNDYVRYAPFPNSDASVYYESTYDTDRGTWVFDETFTFTVVDSVGMSLNIYREAELLTYVSRLDERCYSDSSTWANVTLEAGEKLQFKTEEIFGIPDQPLEYKVNGGVISDTYGTNASEGIEVQYMDVGEHEAGEIFIERVNAYTRTLTSETTKVIPLIVIVTEPSSDFELTNDMVLKNDGTTTTIEIPMDVYVTESSLAELLNYTCFTLVAKDRDDNTINDVSISSIALKEGSEHTIILTLDGTIYTDDKICLSYAPVGDSAAIKDTYGRKLKEFNSVEISYKKVLDDPDSFYGFECNHDWWTISSGDCWSITDEIPNDDGSPNYSVKFYVESEGDLTSASSFTPDATKAPLASFIAGCAYTYSFDVYVSDPDISMTSTFAYCGSNNNISYKTVSYRVDYDGLWYHDSSNTINSNSSVTIDEVLRLNARISKSPYGTCYFDNLSVDYSVGTRP